ncbi:MAG: hypothetical protein IJU76_05935, partial [Desulfovibrionaceae bacterium]|nr:hypothetical protein [Desulfovibrionaceae bacterium]
MAKKIEKDEETQVVSEDTMSQSVPEPTLASAPVENSIMPEAAQAASQALESIAVLADRYRVPTWQLAALLRFMGWTEDKRVRDAEFTEAMRSLQNRRIGGGRR